MKQYLAGTELEHFGWNLDEIFEIGRDSKQKKKQDIPIISNTTELTSIIFLLPIWLKALSLPATFMVVYLCSFSSFQLMAYTWETSILVRSHINICLHSNMVQ
jgi:hypothetical protein